MARMEGGPAFALGKLVDLLPFARREHGSLRAKEPRRCPVAVPEQRASEAARRRHDPWKPVKSRQIR